jgi:hypothetical protein
MSELKVNTISENTSGNGVAIDSVTLKDGGITATELASASTLAIKTNSNTGINIDANGHVTKPLQPCFRVGNGTQNNIAVGSNHTMIFSNEIFDNNADFDTSTYTFTAPVTGKYQFNILVRLSGSDSASSYSQMVLMGSNRNTTMATLMNSAIMNSDESVDLKGSAVLDMDANDTANMRIRIQAGTSQADLDTDGSYFTGYLIG